MRLAHGVGWGVEVGGGKGQSLGDRHHVDVLSPVSDKGHDVNELPVGGKDPLAHGDTLRCAGPPPDSASA